MIEHMVVIAGTGRKGRVFASTLPDDCTELDADFDRAYFDDDEDRVREGLLRAVLSRPVVRGMAHPGVDPSDVYYVYLQPVDPTDGPLFACTLVTRARVEKMLQEAPFVFENFCLQVGAGDDVSLTAQRHVAEWAARNYPDLPIPQFELKLWSEEMPALVAEHGTQSDEDAKAALSAAAQAWNDAWEQMDSAARNWHGWTKAPLDEGGEVLFAARSQRLGREIRVVRGGGDNVRVERIPRSRQRRMEELLVVCGPDERSIVAVWPNIERWVDGLLCEVTTVVALNVSKEGALLVAA